MIQAKRARLSFSFTDDFEKKLAFSGEVEVKEHFDFVGYDSVIKLCNEWLHKMNIYSPVAVYYKEKLLDEEFKITYQEIEKKEVIQFYGKTALAQYKEQQRQVTEKYNRRIKSLEKQVEQLRKRQRPISEIEIVKEDSFVSQPIINNEKNSLDILMLFSQPLYNEKSNKSGSEPVDFRLEIDNLQKTLKNCYQASISMKCEIARIQTLKNSIIREKPKILHIMCHGNSNGQLQFEDDAAHKFGYINYVSPKYLKDNLKTIKELPNLVFINACHSEPIGKAFSQLGVEIVVMINSIDPISDEAAKIFSEHFYREIFNSENIQDAFKKAKNEVERRYKGGCCCYLQCHRLQDHDSQCKWLKLFQKNFSSNQAHKMYHVPSEECACEYKDENRHKRNCSWAQKILFEINPKYRKQNAFYCEENISELFICCCSTDKSNHKEHQKFKILLKNDESTQLFKMGERNLQILDFTPEYLKKTTQPEAIKKLSGRQDQLYRFLEKISQSEICFLQGQSGMGKTFFAKKAASYLIERNRFQSYFKVDLFKIREPEYFRVEFNQVSKLELLKNGTVSSQRKYEKFLVILDECDEFLKRSPQINSKYIIQLKKELKQSHFILILKDTKILQNTSFRENQSRLKLLKLKKWRSASIILNKLREKADISFWLSQAKQISKLDFYTNPRNIENLCQLMPQTQKMNFPDILQLAKKLSSQSENVDGNKQIESILQNLKAQSLEAYKLLIFISLFQDGTTLHDLELFSFNHNEETKEVQFPVKKNWKEQALPYLLKVQKEANPESLSLENSIEIKEDSYFIYKIDANSFIVKNFIRDYIWSSYKEDEIKIEVYYFYIAYFEVALELFFMRVKRDRFITEDLLTYSCLSKAGIFKEKQKGTDQFQGTDMAARSKKANRIKQICMKHEYNFNFNKGDWKTFILKNQKNLLRIYDYNWDKQEKIKSHPTKSTQQLLPSLMLHLPSAFKIAQRNKASSKEFMEMSLRKSNEYLKKIQESQEGKWQIIVTQLKLYVMQIGVLLEEINEKSEEASSNELQQIKQKGQKYLEDQIEKECQAILKKRSFKKLQESPAKLEQPNLFKQWGQSLNEDQSQEKQESQEKFKQLSRDFKEEILTAKLYLLHHYSHDQKKILNLIQQVPKEEKNFDLLRGKQFLLVLMLHLKLLRQNNKSELSPQLLNHCYEFSKEIFKNSFCGKLRLKSQLTWIQIKLEQAKNSNLKEEEKMSLISEQWSKLNKCISNYKKPKNKIGVFTDIGKKIQQLKQTIKDSLWKRTQNTIVFMRAIPFCTDEPQKRSYDTNIPNLLMKKGDFKKNMEKILQGYKPQGKKQNKEDKEKIKSEFIDAKFQILTKQKLEEELKKGCSIMVLSCNFKQGEKGKLYMMVEDECMNECAFCINESESLAEQISSEKIQILIISGDNAMKAASFFSDNYSDPPTIIALDYPNQYSMIKKRGKSQQQAYISSSIYKSKLKRQCQDIYLRSFLENILKLQIESLEQIKEIHEQAMQLLERQLGYQNYEKVKLEIYHKKTRKEPSLKCILADYRDLSTGIEHNNLDMGFFYDNFIIKKGNKIKEILQFIKNKENIKYVNVIGEPKSGKTFFIKSISKLFLERGICKQGVFILDGKTITENHCGSIDSYLLNAFNEQELPSFKGFEGVEGKELLMIIDDFDEIAENSSNQSFLSQMIESDVNVILVSNQNIKMENAYRTKIVEINKLDAFEIEVLAYSTIDFSNQEASERYQKMKSSHLFSVEQIKKLAEEYPLNKKQEKQEKKEKKAKKSKQWKNKK